MNTTLVATVALHAVVTVSSIAQDTGYSTRLEWQVLLPGEDTWRSGLVEIPEATPHVRVRAHAITSGQTTGELLRWSFAWLDPFVHLRNGAGPGDSIDSIGNGDFLNNAVERLVTHRIGDVIKLDVPADTLPPGEGQHWYSAREGTPDFDGYRPATLSILEYTLHLDGTPGDREIGHVFGHLPPATTPETPVYLLRLIPVSPFFEPVRPSVTVSNAVIRVVPTPGTTAILTVILLAPRRRR